ncbi:hypothetical protein FF2_015300 [Malus domestica]
MIQFNLMENTGLFLGYRRRPNYFLCNVCNTYGTINNVRMIPFWNFNYCKTHESDGTPRCNTCDRFKTTGQNGYVNLGNNQQLCSECFSTAILHPSKCKRLIENVRKFYKKLGLQVDKKIPILLIDDDEIRRIHPNEQMLKVVGLTTYPPYTVMTVYVAYVWVVTDFKMFKERVMIGATLAHEMMHAWLALQGCNHLEKKVSEGICEVLAHIWLTSCCKKGLESYNPRHGHAVFLENLQKYATYKIESNVDKNYGQGFREANMTILSGHTFPQHGHRECDNGDEIDDENAEEQSENFEEEREDDRSQRLQRMCLCK